MDAAEGSLEVISRVSYEGPESLQVQTCDTHYTQTSLSSLLMLIIYHYRIQRGYRKTLDVHQRICPCVRVSNAALML